ncbi:MAG TPA: chemotaxis protein CheW [Gemmatimonadaceae bacterium]|jgi:purine-binding chemotaxis protein CheW|nr:chemotaxis protein CheW [Gemmatimonadaceae bacterium]
MSESVAVPPEQAVEETPRVPTRRLLAFEVGGAVFACDMESFREIVPTQRTTRLPGAPDTVCGLINLRGTIVTVIDGGVVLGKPSSARTSGLILLADYFERLVGVAVDDVRDIHDVPIDQFASADAPEPIAEGIVTGEVEIEGRRVMVLDVRALVQKVIGQGR